MEEKKQKISLGTAICLAVIFILVVVIILGYMYYNVNKNNVQNENVEKKENIIANEINSEKESEKFKNMRWEGLIQI